MISSSLILHVTSFSISIISLIQLYYHLIQTYFTTIQLSISSVSLSSPEYLLSSSASTSNSISHSSSSQAISIRTTSYSYLLSSLLPSIHSKTIYSHANSMKSMQYFYATIKHIFSNTSMKYNSKTFLSILMQVMNLYFKLYAEILYLISYNQIYPISTISNQKQQISNDLSIISHHHLLINFQLNLNFLVDNYLLLLLYCIYASLYYQLDTLSLVSSFSLYTYICKIL